MRPRAHRAPQHSSTHTHAYGTILQALSSGGASAQQPHGAARGRPRARVDGLIDGVERGVSESPRLCHGSSCSMHEWPCGKPQRTFESVRQEVCECSESAGRGGWVEVARTSCARKARHERTVRVRPMKHQASSEHKWNASRSTMELENGAVQNGCHGAARHPSRSLSAPACSRRGRLACPAAAEDQPWPERSVHGRAERASFETQVENF